MVECLNQESIAFFCSHEVVKACQSYRSDMLRKSELKPLSLGDNRILFSATGDEEFNDVDWTLRLEGWA